MDIEDLNQNDLKKIENELFQRKCVKCRDNISHIKITAQKTYCRTCFIDNMNRQFQTFLKKYRTHLSNKRVMVAFSGGYSSSVLVDLINKSVSKYHQTKFPFQPVVVYIDFKHKLSNISQLKNKPIYDYFTKLNVDCHIYYKCQLESESLYCNELSYHTLLMHNLQKLAQKLDIQFILTGHNCNHLSALAFTYLGLGQGDYALQLMRSEQLNIDQNIKIYKPFKDILAKQIAFYHFYCGLDNFSEFDFGNNPPVQNNSHILQYKQQHLLYTSSNEFLNQLQSTNECTISTIMRTFEKFKIQKDYRI